MKKDLEEEIGINLQSENEKKLSRIRKNFESLLKKIDSNYNEKIKYQISYSSKEDKYKLSIESLDKLIQVSSFFNDFYLHELGKFCSENKIDFPKNAINNNNS